MGSGKMEGGDSRADQLGHNDWLRYHDRGSRSSHKKKGIGKENVWETKAILETNRGSFL